ncbi:MAG: hypothetical protein FWE60_04010, partial [Oscillospiraceae bacterium]|nr:hypothetical protein [Oscillospiraceae bacterium]
MFSGKKGLGIRSKITVLLAVLLLINALAAGIFSYAFYRSGSIEAHGQTAISIAQSVGISGEKILRITQAMEKTEEWLEMKSRLNTLTDSTDAIAVYVLGLPARESLLYPFLALSNAEINIGSVKHADDMAPEISFAYSLATPVSSGVYESDGEYIITGFVPVFSPDGVVVGVVSADISAGKIRSDAFSFAAKVALISVLLIAALSAVAF